MRFGINRGAASLRVVVPGADLIGDHHERVTAMLTQGLLDRESQRGGVQVPGGLELQEEPPHAGLGQGHLE